MNLDDLVATATVGARHRAIDLTAVPPALQPDSLSVDPAVAVLDAAVLATCARRTVPAVTTPPDTLNAPRPESLPVVSEQVQQVLARLWEHRDILVEALREMHAAGYRLPPELVPVFLDDNRGDVVEAARRVSGQVGRWLMTKNPRWAAVLIDPADRTGWEEGTQAQRGEWLHLLRRADPSAARELLAAELGNESAVARAAFLAVLADGLGPDDEPLLVRLLADRSAAVAAVALDLLVQLPGSVLRRGMMDIVGRRLSVQRGLLRSTVSATEPDAAEFAGWPGASDGLAAALSRVDPADWPALVNGDLMAQDRHEAQALDPLRRAIEQAAIAFRHSELCAVLVEQELARSDPRAPQGISRALWASLHPTAGWHLVERLWDRGFRLDTIVEAMAALPRPWGRELALTAPAHLVSVESAPPGSERSGWQLWASAVALPDCAAAAAAARAALSSVDHQPARLRPVGTAITVVTLRSVLASAFNPSGDSR